MIPNYRAKAAAVPVEEEEVGQSHQTQLLVPKNRPMTDLLISKIPKAIIYLHKDSRK